MDDPKATTSSRSRGLVIAAGVILVVLVVWGVTALLGNSGDSPSRTATATSTPGVTTASSPTSKPGTTGANGATGAAGATGATEPGGGSSSPTTIGSSPAASPGGSSGASPGTTPTGGSGTSPDAGSTGSSGGGTTASGPYDYDYEGCVLLRQLLGMVDDAELRSSAVSLGCL